LSLSVGEYLRSLGAIPLPTNVPSEEVAPDFTVGVNSSDAKQLATIRVSETATPEVNLRFFIDGVQRTVPICLVRVENLMVPIYITHLIAGATERVNGRLRPFLRREAIVLYLPLEGLRNVNASLPTPSVISNPLHKFDYTGNIYELVRSFQQPRQLTFWTDISVKLSSEETNLDPAKLSAVGAVRKAARDRSKVLLRIMELGVTWEIVISNILDEDEFIVLDGPVFLPLKYAGLTSQQLATVMDATGEQIGNTQQAYHLLRHLIGIVKNVQVIPVQGLAAALSLGPSIVIPIYLFSTTVRGATDLVSRHTLACFVWLRRELHQEIPLIWSPASGLSRIDIPFPAIVNPEVTWYTPDFQPDLSEGSYSRRRLEAILRTVVADRWPVPETSPHRMLTELYAIAETERWLKAHLLPEQELRELGGI